MIKLRSNLSRLLLASAFLCSLAVAPALHAAGEGGSGHGDAVPIPRSLDSYQDEGQSVIEMLQSRIAEEPFNLFATVIFFLAIVHTFLAGKFRDLAHKFEHDHHEKIQQEGRTGEHKPYDKAIDDVSFKSEICHFLGEVEAIFGIWLIPLFAGIIVFFDWGTVAGFIDTKVHYTEPMFVVVIMSIASTRPVLKFAEACLRVLANLGKCTPAAWWLSILTVAPVLGSFITEPAAMTIAAIMLGTQFYRYEPPERFKYGTLGLLFVNISVGGTLTHFAAPPVLMVAGRWEWGIAHMIGNFGWKAVIGIIISTIIYYVIFKKDFAELNRRAAEARAAGEEVKRWSDRDDPIPVAITITHLLFLAWTVFNLHHPALFIGGFLFFLAFAQATAHHQNEVNIKGPLLVGFFLAGLVTHGVLQSWWIAPVLSSLGDFPLFVGATVLTAFNDNAAITFLAAQVPAFDPHMATDLDLMARLQYAVVAGAVTGGGLTVIANAPNPAGQSILQKYFKGGVSPLGLATWALIPTLVMAVCFMVIR